MKRVPFVRFLPLWMFFVPFLTVADGSVAINEVMASNVGPAADEDGDTADWIELYNPGPAPVALGGYALSDNQLAPFRWVFPDVSIAPGEFLLVWASGKNRALGGAPLHTNFSIAAGGEPILLTAPNGVRVDEIGPRAISTNVSLGRQPDGTGDWSYFTRPTPGSANVTTAYAGLTPAPVFSAAPGFYAQGFDLHVASAGPDAVIYYTLDGSAPDPANLSGRTYRFMNHYPGGSLINRQYRTFTYWAAIPVVSRVGEGNGISMIPTAFNGFPRPGAGWEAPAGEVFKATVVRAMAMSPNFVPSPVSTATYFIDKEKSARYTFPVISLTTTEGDLFDYDRGIYVPGRTFNEWRLNNPNAPLNGASPANYLRDGPGWELPAHIEFYEPGGELAFAQNVGIRIHGGWSRVNRQKALRVFARNTYDEKSSISHPIFPGHQRQGGGGVLDEFKRLILHISGQDNGLTMFRDAMAQSLIAHTGIDTLAYRPAVVFLNGEYWGFHNIRERYDHHYVATNYEVEPEEVVILQGNVEVVAGEPGDDLPYRQMVQFIANAASQGTIDQPEVFAQIEKMMDIENFIHHYAAQIYYANIDWPAGNLRWWRYKGEPNPDRYGQDGKWRWMMFDTDHGFGLFVTDGWGGWRIQADHNTVSHATTSGATPVLWSNPLWATQLFRSLLVSQTFRHRFLNTYADHLNSSFKPERVIARIDEMQAHVAPEYPEYSRRWNHPSAFWDGGDTWEKKVEVMRTFAQARQGYIRMYLNNHFALGGLAPLTLDVADNDGGRIRVNSMVLDEKTPGAGQSTYPWTGFYFRTVPVVLEAKPLPGYRLVRWRDGAGADLGDSPVIELLVDAARTVSAEFEVDPAATFIPAPHALSEGAYSLNFWAPDSSAGTYPPHLIFEQTQEEDPVLATAMDSYWELAYNFASRSRVVGLSGEGFAFINTGSAQAMEGAGYLGSAILALSTMGEENIRVSWTGGTVVPNSRVYGVRLQARVGDVGSFIDLLDASGGPIEYLRNGTPGHSRTIGPVTLPEIFGNRPCVQLRWKYCFTGQQLDPSNGQRSMLRVSDILVTSGLEESFGAWREAWFGVNDLDDPAVSGPEADPAGHGVPNLLRYALGMDLSGASGETLPQVTVTESRLEMSFYRDPAKSDIAYIVEGSSDLQGWAEVLYDSRADSRENEPGGKIRIVDTKMIGETDGGKRFIRLRVLLLD